ncbi:ABC transporter A family member 1 [Camellia lanceoleosa]|nr:ABC transporter A family member 1 [Camellia lanceoleosa]
MHSCTEFPISHWLAKEKFSTIEAFIISSFPGATCQCCNGLSIKYQVSVQILQCQNMNTGHLKHLFLSKLLFRRQKAKEGCWDKDVKSPGDPKFMDAFGMCFILYASGFP